MIVGDFLTAVPYALGALAGFLAGAVTGRADWNQRVSYWQQRALFRRDLPPPMGGPSAAPARPDPQIPRTGPRQEEAA